MTDTQSPTTESQTTIDDARARSRRSFIAVLKANRDVFSNLPERIEQWLEKETRATNQPETTKHGRDESERLARSDMQKQLECFQAEINANTQSLVTLDQTVREMTAALEAMKSVHSSMVFSRDRYVERELKEKEDTIEANKEQLKLVEEENLKLKEELKKKEKEAKDKITKQEERIASLEGEQEKKERQIVEITREEKEKTEGLINEHQKEVDKLLREIQTMKEKLLKKSDYIQKMYEDYNKNLADHKSRNDVLLEEFEKREEEIAKYTQIIARLESEQEKKEKQIVEIAREEKEKTEGLTNEHQKEVDKLLREIQAMKEKNDTLLKEKEVEITNYTHMNLKLKEELKKEEKVAKEREEKIALLEGEQEKKERQIVEIAREVEEKTEGLTNEHQTEVDKLIREIQTTKERNDTLLKGLKNMEEEITKCTQINLTLKEEMKKKEEEAKEKIKELEGRIVRLEGEQEKKEMQIVEIAREEKEKTEDLKNEHQKEVDKFLREIQTMKEKTEGLTNEHQKEVDKLLSEIQTMKKKNDTLLREKEEEIAKYTQMNLKLKEELKKKEKEAKDKIKEREERIVRLESEQKKKERQIVEIARQEKEKTEGLINEHQKEVDKLFREIQTMKEKEKELKGKCKALLESKDEELKEIKIRLMHLSKNLVKKDQRNMEDTAAVNRPSEVEKEFAYFFDNERMDAIEKMQSVYGSEEDNDIDISYSRLACMIFEAAYEKTTEAKDSALHVFRETINEMIKNAAELGEAYSLSEKYKLSSHRVNLKIPTYSQELKYPTEVLDTLMISLKETAHLCSPESMKEDVRRKVTEKWASWLASEKSCKFSFSNQLLFQLKDYVQACILLSWRMVVQVPPMQLEYRCTTLKNFHRKVGYHSSPEMCSRPPPNGQGAAGDEIACYLWPALLDGGGRVIRPGEVLCKVEAEAI